MIRAAVVGYGHASSGRIDLAHKWLAVVQSVRANLASQAVEKPDKYLRLKCAPNKPPPIAESAFAPFDEAQHRRRIRGDASSL